MDINGRFQRFRDSLIRDTYDRVLRGGGRIDLHGADIALEFPSVRNFNDVIGTVSGLSLTAVAERPGSVTFTYMTPGWCESNSDYIDVDDDPAEHEVCLDELSSNELYNILKAINL